MEINWLFVKLLFVIWIVSAIVECKELEKRDVHHKIVVKTVRKPRSHRNRPKHHHSSSRGRGKHHSGEKDFASFEDDHGSYFGREESIENSFEDITNNYKQTRHHSDVRPFKPHVEFEDLKSQSFKDDGWTPLVSIENTSFKPHKKSRSRHPNSSRENYQHHFSQRYQSSKRNHHQSPKRYKSRTTSYPKIELTTNYPNKVPYTDYFESTDFPPIPSISAYNHFNQKAIDSNQSPLISTVSLFVKPKFEEFEKNLGPSYAVEESRNDEVTEKNHNTFQILAPALAAANLQLAAQDIKNENKNNLNKEEQPLSQTKRPPLLRGRGKIRAKLN